MNDNTKTVAQNYDTSTGFDNGDKMDTVCLKVLYPADNRNLNDLFPEQELRKLFRDVVAGIEDVKTFVEKTDHSLKKERQNAIVHRT